ncbi:MAG: hypothetical protein WC479_00450 [Candidatus Izemoplasmatales bacterium]|jgi:hypothetical protein
MTNQPANGTNVTKSEEPLNSVIDEIIGSVIVVKTLKGKKRFDIGKLFMIDQNLISDEMSSQASMYGFFAILAAEADRISALKSMLYDQETAQADESYRQQLELDGKKYTEAVVRSMVIRDEECVKALTAKEDADYDLNILKAIVRAFEQRAMMLQSLGSQLRHEYDMQGMHTKESDLEQATEKLKSTITRRRLHTEGEGLSEK